MKMNMKMYNPCETCYNRFGHEYTPDCDEQCEFANLVKENKRLRAELSNIIHGRVYSKKVEDIV